MCHLVFIDHLLLFHFLDSHHFVGLSVATHPHFSKGTPPDDFDWHKVLYGKLGSLKAIVFAFLVKNLLFDEFFLLLTELHAFHLVSELVPGLLSLSLFVLGFGILVLYIRLG